MNDNQRKYLQENVNSLVFVDDDKNVIDNYKCISCKQLAITHNVANCKHIFCSHCIRDVFYKMCPVCQDVIVTTASKDDQFENELLNLKVKCKYNSHGCNELIPLRNFQDHENNCECSIKLLLPKIYRGSDVQSQDINLGDDVQQLKAAVNEICVALKTMNQHLEKIVKSNQINDVEFETENAKSKKKKNTISEENEILDTQEQSNIYWEEEDQQYTTVLWKITGFKQKLQKLKNLDLQEIKSELFYDVDSGYKFKARLFLITIGHHANAQNIAIDLECTKSIQFDHARKITLIDQSNKTCKKHLSIIDYYQWNLQQACLTGSEMLNCILLPCTLLLENDSFMKNNAVLIKISIIPILLMKKRMNSCINSLTWCIDNYSAKKQDEIQGFSRCLTKDISFSRDLKMQAHLYLDGISQSKGIYISIYFAFITRPNCNFEIHFSLLDQTETTNKHHMQSNFMYTSTKQIQNQMVPKIGRHDFVLHSQAENTMFLKNDTLLFKIDIEVRQNNVHQVNRLGYNGMGSW